jgi:hypothetical protein
MGGKEARYEHPDDQVENARLTLGGPHIGLRLGLGGRSVRTHLGIHPGRRSRRTSTVPLRDARAGLNLEHLVAGACRGTVGTRWASNSSLT